MISTDFKINTAKSKAICFRNASGKGPHDVVRKSKALNLSLRGSNFNLQGVYPFYNAFWISHMVLSFPNSNEGVGNFGT